MSETKRTPGKWYTGRGVSWTGNGIPETFVYREGQERIQILGENCDADADYICRAVNCHERLVEAAQTLLYVMRHDVVPEPMCERGEFVRKREYLDSLIAEAEGGGNG